MEKNKNKIKKILFVIVMTEESSAILDKHEFVKDENFSKGHENILESFVKCTGDLDEQIIIVRPLDDPLNKTGLFGTEIAFLLTYIAIKHYQPDVVISMGYAGDTGVLGEEQQEIRLTCGSVVIAKEKSIYHRREMIIAPFKNTSEGHYPVESCDKLVKDLSYCSCYVGTANSFVSHDDVAVSKKIHVVEMELCSVARACYYFRTPCIGVKIISDGKNDYESEEIRQKQFLESLVILRNKFNETFLKISEYLKYKSVEEI
jgi:nucleoside phosphorylase